MAEYADIPSIAVIYEGTKESFDKLSDKSKYYGRVVFITGSTATNATAVEKQQAIWVSNDEGDNAHFLNMSDVSTLAAQLSYIDGLAIESTDGTTTNQVPYNIEGGKGFLFAGDNGIKISIDPDSAVNINNKLYWRIKVDAENLKTQIETAQSDATEAASAALNANSRLTNLVGNDEGKTVREIAADELVGDKDSKSDSNTIWGAKNYADELIAGLSTDGIYVTPTDLVNGDGSMDGKKIASSLLPDAILGQLKFGGVIGSVGFPTSSTPNVPIKVKPSSDYVKEFGLDSFDAFPVTESGLEPFDPLLRKGWYFIVGQVGEAQEIGFEWGNKDYNVGDWFLSIGTEWTKIDNTDAVSSVVGETGAVTIDQIKNAWGAIKASEMTGDVQASLSKADSSIQNIGVQASSIDPVDAYLTVGIKQKGSATDPKTAYVKTLKATMGEVKDDSNKKGLAMAEDVYNFIKARLSIKVVNTTNN